MTARMVIMETKQGDSLYMCAPCVQEMAFLIAVPLKHGKSQFTHSRQEMIGHMASPMMPMGSMKEALINSISDLEAKGREMIKRIRSYDGRYTDRNVVCKDIQALLKQIFSSVTKHLT
jgi:hypothetical protein